MSASTLPRWCVLGACLYVLVLATGCGGGSADSSRDEGESTVTALREQGGEKSIEGFGREATAGQRTAILAAFEGALDALGEEDFAAACAGLDAGVRASLGKLSGSGGRGVTCERALPQFLAPSAAAVARQQAGGRVTKVRVQGGRAFVVFRAPGAKLYVTGLLNENGRWKTTTVIPSVLVPEL